MKQRLMRPTAALFPIAGIAGALLGNYHCVMILFVSYYLMQLFSLCAADCFRNAAAREPGVRRVDSRFGGSFIPLAVGIILTGLAWEYGLSIAWRIPNWHGACIAAALVCIEHLFEERMYVLGRRMDGAILSCIANGLLAAGLILGSGNITKVKGASMYAMIGAGLGAAISIATSYAIEPIHGFSLKPQNLRFAASAVPQTLLYPIIAVITTLFTKKSVPEMTLFLLSGLIAWRLARTTFRRTEDESRRLNLLLIACAAIPTALSTFETSARPVALMAYIALICATIIFCYPTERHFIGIILIAIAFLTPPIIATILSLAAIAINLHKAFLKKV